MPAVVIISADEDFSSVIAEQLKRELSLESAVAADLKGAQELGEGAHLIISDAPIADAHLPVLELSKARAPLRMKEVLAQAKAMLVAPSEHIDIGGGYRFLPRARQMHDASGKSIELTDREMALVAALLAAGEEGIGKDALLKQVWGFEPDINTHTLETHVYRLRSKVREMFGTEMIAAIEGGYKLEL